MDATTSNRREALNSAVLLLVILGAVNAAIRIPNFADNIVFQVITLITSKGVYEIIIRTLYWVINSSDTVLRFYWGKTYLKGLWSYEYVLNGITYFGVWDIRQDVEGTTLVGNGLGDDFLLRTIVRSVSPLLEETNGYYFINRRNEMDNENAQVFSKTTLLLDRAESFLHGVQTMRGITEVYGGPSDKQVHPNVIFKKHPDTKSVELLIEKLKALSD